VKTVHWWVPINKKINCDEMLAGNQQQDRAYYLGFWAFDPQLPGTELSSTNFKLSLCKKTYWKDP